MMGTPHMQNVGYSGVVESDNKEEEGGGKITHIDWTTLKRIWLSDLRWEHAVDLWGRSAGAGR